MPSKYSRVYESSSNYRVQSNVWPPISWSFESRRSSIHADSFENYNIIYKDRWKFKIQFSIGFPLSRLEHDLKNFSHRPISNFEILRSQRAYGWQVNCNDAVLPVSASQRILEMDFQLDFLDLFRVRQKSNFI